MFKIRKNGEIISEREWLLQNQNKEARSHMKDLLAQAVVHKGRVKSLGNFSMFLIFKCWNLSFGNRKK